jgi:hypothetical protein
MNNKKNKKLRSFEFKKNIIDKKDENIEEYKQ